MRPRLADRLDQLVDDVLRRRQVRIAHAEVDDVGAARTRRSLQPVHLGEDVGRQTLYTVELLWQGSLEVVARARQWCLRPPGQCRPEFRRQKLKAQSSQRHYQRASSICCSASCSCVARFWARSSIAFVFSAWVSEVEAAGFRSG